VKRPDLRSLASATFLACVPLAAGAQPAAIEPSAGGQITPQSLTIACTARIEAPGSMIFDVPAFNCNAAAPAGTRVSVENSPPGTVCSSSAAGDPLQAAQSSVAALVEKIRTGAGLANSERLAIQAIADSPEYEFTRSAGVLNQFIRLGPRDGFVHWSPASRVPSTLTAPPDPAQTVSAGADARFHWWCIGDAQLRTFWRAMLRVTAYDADMAAYWAIWGRP